MMLIAGLQEQADQQGRGWVSLNLFGDCVQAWVFGVRIGGVGGLLRGRGEAVRPGGPCE
jgi:hypothetical protein